MGKYIICKPNCVVYVIGNKLNGGKQFRGVAKCHKGDIKRGIPPDEWNEEKGRKIAKLRAEYKRYAYELKKLRKEYEKIRSWADQKCAILDRKIFKLEDQIFDNEDSLSDLARM